MRTVARNVHYCDHCGRHRLTKRAIEQHEPRCIYNPERAVCGWHEKRHAAIVRPRDYTAHFAETLDFDWLRREADGCPACMLAVIIQCDVPRAELDWVYKDEVERFRDKERAEVSLW